MSGSTASSFARLLEGCTDAWSHYPCADILLWPPWLLCVRRVKAVEGLRCGGTVVSIVVLSLVSIRVRMDYSDFRSLELGVFSCVRIRVVVVRI